MEKSVFSEETLIRILTRRKHLLKEDSLAVLNKLKRKEKLTDKEFWNVFDMIKQEGPDASYSNPDNWINTDEYKN